MEEEEEEEEENEDVDVDIEVSTDGPVEKRAKQVLLFFLRIYLCLKYYVLN